MNTFVIAGPNTVTTTTIYQIGGSTASGTAASSLATNCQVHTVQTPVFKNIDRISISGVIFSTIQCVPGNEILYAGFYTFITFCYILPTAP
jgi:hypothetical protein